MTTSRLAAALGLLVTSPACLMSQMSGGGIGTFPVVDDQLVAKAKELKDPELTADLQRVPRSPNTGSGEYYVALCMKQYVEARYAEHRLETDTAGDVQEKAMFDGQAMGYGGCASTCKSAFTQVTSSLSPIAQKYHPKCESAFAGKKSKMWIDALATAVEQFRAAKAPLELYFGSRDSELALTQATSEAPPGEPRLVELTNQIRTLNIQHAGPIKKAKSFLDTPEVHGNTAKRESLQAEIASIESEIKAGSNTQSGGSLDAYMAKRERDDQVRVKQRLLDAKRRELARLKEDFNRLAIRAGVLRA